MTSEHLAGTTQSWVLVTVNSKRAHEPLRAFLGPRSSVQRRDLQHTETHATVGASGHNDRGGKSGGDEERGWERDRYNDRDRNRDWQCDALVVAGIGIALEHATHSSHGFCIVREITRGGTGS